MKVHHNTAKKAAKFGIELKVEDNEISAYKGDKLLASGLQGNVVLEAAIAKLDGEQVTAPKANKAKAAKVVKDDDEDGDESETEETDEAEVEAEDDEEVEGGKSIVKRKYKQRYRPFKMTCGDELSQLISQHVSFEDEEAGGRRIDKKLLKRFAQANGVWDPKYAHLNPGMQRMNIANRLRKLVREGHEVVWAL